MNNGWIKYFADGTKEVGYDHLVQSKLASWSKGRLKDICFVELYHENKRIGIRGTGEFWQSDTFETQVLTNGQGQLVKRTLYKKLHEQDNAITSICLGINNMIADCTKVPLDEYSLYVDDGQVGKWFILDLENGKFSWRIGSR